VCKAVKVFKDKLIKCARIRARFEPSYYINKIPILNRYTSGQWTQMYKQVEEEVEYKCRLKEKKSKPINQLPIKIAGEMPRWRILFSEQLIVTIPVFVHPALRKVIVKTRPVDPDQDPIRIHWLCGPESGKESRRKLRIHYAHFEFRTERYGTASNRKTSGTVPNF
jgi:hypothetical protein